MRRFNVSLIAAIMSLVFVYVPQVSGNENGEELSPIVVDSDDAEVRVDFSPGQLIDLKCKAENGQKMWVLLRVPSLYPEIEFARPSDAYCEEHDRYVFPVTQESEDLYYAESFNGSKIDFGLNDFTGLDELIIATKKGDSPASLETIQTITLVESAGPAMACIQSGGSVTTASCCLSVGDFPNLCLIGPCGCSPDNSHLVQICDCGPGRCFDGSRCVDFPGPGF
jgi:hypothetical protein